MQQKPLVSVMMLTYNHEKYIAEALNSVLCQKVDFTYEIIIGDDASSDHTPDIIREYAAKYPCIKPILRKKNLGANQNAVDLIKRCQGEYIAPLEGDDSWCNDSKMRNQVRFLKKHPEYVGIASWCNLIDKNSEINWYASGDHYVIFPKHEFTMTDFQEGKIPGQCGTAMFHNIWSSFNFNWESIMTADPLIGDQSAFFLYLSTGKNIYVTFQKLSNYRFVSNTVCNNYTSLANNTRFDSKEESSLIRCFRLYNSIENLYADETGKRIHLRKRKYPFLREAFRLMLHKLNKHSVLEVYTILHEETHPCRLIFETIVDTIKIKCHVIKH